MGEKHVQNILKKFKGNYETHDIKVNHNEERPNWAINAAFDKIKEALNKKIDCNVNSAKKRGLSITKTIINRF